MHRIISHAPLIEVTRNADRLHSRRPDYKFNSFNPALFLHPRAKILIALVQAASTQQVKVEIGNIRRKAVRILRQQRKSLRIFYLKLIIKRLAYIPETNLEKISLINPFHNLRLPR